MKITHINLAAGFRGGERQTLLLIEALSLKNIEQELVCRPNADIANRASHIANLKITPVRKPYFIHAQKLKNTDLVHVHEGRSGKIALTAHTLFKTPYVITRRIPNKPSNNLISRQVYQNAKSIVCLSRAIEKNLNEYAPNLKTCIIPSMVANLPQDKNFTKKIRENFKDKFLLGHVGALSMHHKGQQFIIAAARQLASSHPQLHFLLLGSGQDEEALREQAKGLDNITFVGFVNNVGDYLAAFNLFIFPSLEEGLGSILLDAMQFSNAIIASDVDGIPDIVHHEKNGLLIPPGNSHELTSAIIRLFNNKSLREQLANQGKADLNRFQPVNIAQEYLVLYNHVLNQKKALL